MSCGRSHDILCCLGGHAPAFLKTTVTVENKTRDHSSIHRKCRHSLPDVVPRQRLESTTVFLSDEGLRSADALSVLLFFFFTGEVI